MPLRYEGGPIAPLPRLGSPLTARVTIAAAELILQLKLSRPRQSHRLSAKLLQVLIKHCGIIPESCMPCVSHDVNLRVRYAGLVLFGCGRFDNRISGAMSNQYRFGHLW